MQVFVVGSFVVACSVKVARLPRAAESLDASTFLAEPGGKGFNVAVAAHRLGAAVDGLFAIGSDLFATVARATFARIGFPAEMLVVREGSTGAGVGFVDPAGENCLAVCLGANLALTGDDIARAQVRLSRAGIVAATFESPDAPIREAFRGARARGARTVLNPSPVRALDPDILANTSLLVVNAVEAAALGLGEPGTFPRLAEPTDAIRALLQAGPDLLVVTLGHGGAVAFAREGTPCHQPAFPVDAIDTIGAGDAFTAGLAVGLSQGRPLAQALRRANACGALTATRFGAFEAFPTSAALETFLDHPAPLGPRSG